MDRPELQTERLLLRPMEISDADRIVEFLSDYEVSRWLGRVPHPYDKNHALDWVQRSQKVRPDDENGFVLDMGKGLIGGIGFHLIEGVPSLGYWLAKPNWGQGLMSEAAEAVIAWLFERTNQQLITSGVFEGNEASLRIQEKLGFEECGRRMQHSLARGEDLPHIDTRLHRNQFRPLAS